MVEPQIFKQQSTLLWAERAVYARLAELTRA
jgi:hypothetical protein